MAFVRRRANERDNGDKGVMMKFEPRYYQTEAFLAVRKAIKEYDGPVFLDMSVGAGKTYCMAMVAKRFDELGLKGLVMTWTGTLVSQDSDAAWELGVPNSIYCASLGRKASKENTIFASVKSFRNAMHTVFKDFVPAYVLYDENHEMVFDNPESESRQVIDELLRRNPKLYIIGYTGSPYRGVNSIVGDFWKRCIYTKDMQTLTDEGYLVPAVFGGHDVESYDLSEFSTDGDEGCGDFTASELAAMQRKISKDVSKTQSIMREVMAKTAGRNSVLVTCAGRKHMAEAASVLPAGSFVMIDATTADREKEIDKIRNGAYKYILQIGCLVTGFDAPIIDTNVILRRIGSLRLLIQLVGRSARLLKPHQEESGLTKTDHLILDYAETFANLGDMYFNPILEQEQFERSKREGSLIHCPECGGENSEFARRCIHNDANGNRCEFFFRFKECDCGCKNDIAARECRECGKVLIDPNEKLNSKAYTNSDWKPVRSMEMSPTQNGGLCVRYHLDCHNAEGKPEVASLYFNPWSNEQSRRIYLNNFVYKHINSWPHRNQFGALKNVESVLKMKAMLDVPEFVTHRINDKGKSIVHGMKFKTREVKGSKEIAEK